MQIMGSGLMSGRRRDGDREDRHGYACRSGGMSVDNGLHLMSGGRRGYRDKKEGWRDEWAGGRGMALSSYPCAMLIEHTSMVDVCLRLQPMSHLLFKQI